MMKINELANNLTFKRLLFVLLTAGASLSILYMLSIYVISSVFLLGFAYYLAISFSYMFLVNLIGMTYRIAFQMGHPLPGIFSTLMGHLTQEQWDLLSKDYKGRRDALIHEFVLLRMDILLPASIIFGAVVLLTLPAFTTSELNVAALLVGTIASIFVLTYLIFTGLQAYLYGIKVAGTVLAEEKVENVIQSTFLAIT